MLQHRVVLGDLHWIVRGDERGGGGQKDTFGLRADVGERCCGRRREKWRVVMLSDSTYIQPDILSVLRNGHDRINAFLLGWRVTRCRVTRNIRDAKDSKLHIAPFPLPA